LGTVRRLRLLFPAALLDGIGSGTFLCLCLIGKRRFSAEQIFRLSLESETVAGLKNAFLLVIQHVCRAVPIVIR
jgi:hypothetical protein